MNGFLFALIIAPFVVPLFWIVLRDLWNALRQDFGDR